MLYTIYLQDKQLNMKTMKNLIILVLLSFIMCSFTSRSTYNYNLSELEITLEDMNEWVVFDVENGVVDSTIGDTYVDNINRCLKHLKEYKEQI